ncbi:uncharacterized protein LOC124533792 [Vanessa cardui]|uniref:uncharacterized protein LOC124533792 n=1 Tax=Vanessa cardui TaxID=171605 RepID=UPI001F143DB7|nr:uncharacterized protein LOC124533792 [Vanessa cardui]
MDCDDNQKPYKQRFKGVENFLRRVAFNLGNTASQTEVKIISCIPIDVTDLQQKIISLEKQLHEASGHVPPTDQPARVPSSTPARASSSTPARAPSSTPARAPSTNPARAPSSNPARAPSSTPAPAPVPSPDTAPAEKANRKSENNLNKKKPSTTVNLAQRAETGFNTRSSTVSYCTSKPNDKVRSSQFGSYSGGGSSRIRKSNVSFVFPALTTSDNKHECEFSIRKNCNNDSAAVFDRYRNIFRKRKRKNNYKDNNKIKTHLVYYAHHTADNPFKKTDDSLKYNGAMSYNDEVCISYLNKIIRRQYDPNEIVEEFSNTSNFSRPICRDVGNTNRNMSKYDSESDTCSCCHDKYRNIDHYMTKGYDSIITKLHTSLNNTSSYYDSNHYDVIPVKENCNKILKNNNEQKLENEKSVEIKCWPEHLRTKQKCQPYFYNYQAEIPVKRRANKVLQDMLLMRNNLSGKPSKKRENTRVPEQQAGSLTSKSFCIDCSDVYAKPFPRPTVSKKIENLATVSKKHESVATDEIVNKLNVNNQSTQLDISKVEDYKELTLSQIKTILQSVLDEVKISAKANNTSDEVIKKDAVVQKGASQNSLPGASTFLQSYTYNDSYNTNSHLASCSKQTPLAQCCVTGLPHQPLKCLQNYPVFIQPAPGRHMCACYYKKNSYKPQTRHATTAATNTDRDQILESSETDKLIKEIYKSMAINMDFPNKDSSKSECNNLKLSSNVSSNTIEVKNVGVSNKIGFKVDAKVSPIQSYLSQTKIGYESAGAQSEDRKQAIRLNNNEVYCETERLKFHSAQSSDSIAEVENETDDSNDDSDSAETLVLEEYKQDRKTKKGFFNRMLKSVNLFKKKKGMPTEREASDSDDYETVYSEKSANVPPKRYRKVKTTAQYDRARTKQSPYLEQEYRRQWNEGLAFREQRESICSSERPNVTHSNQIPTRPLYWTDFEARNASVYQKTPNQFRINDSVRQNEIGIQQNEVKNGKYKERLGWLKKHKLGIKCGEQWKKFILES